MIISEDVFKEEDGFLIVDMQHDFCLGGALPIEKGDRIVPILNDWIILTR